MGQQKLLLPWAGKAVLRHIVDELDTSEIDRTIVVTGGDHDLMVDCLKGCDVVVERNRTVHEGMLSSVRTGLKKVGEGAHAVMIVLGDQPSLSSSLINGVIGFWRKDGSRIVRPAFNGGHGHPVLIPIGFREKIMSEFDDVGLKGLVHQFPDRVREWDVDDPGVLIDIDTPEDYAHELARLQSSTSTLLP
ncbi:nucleotidyltransferase family protein [bacterium]|jgi:molybdenum cofactor cytidylyltransferase|nr:nucleotidyltransferase family protein [bacterium]